MLVEAAQPKALVIVSVQAGLSWPEISCTGIQANCHRISAGAHISGLMYRYRLWYCRQLTSGEWLLEPS